MVQATESKTEKMRASILEELAWDKRIDSSGIQVEVRGSTARLTGSVPTYAERRHAGRDALCTPGIAAVENHIEVTHPDFPAVPSDQDIQVSVRSILSLTAALPAARIRTAVEGGVVALQGSVDSLWQKVLAEERTADVDGVLGIRNELTVVPTEKYDDEAIARSIVSALERTGSADVNEIDITVANGIVTLAGSVPDWMAHRAVLDVIQCTGGVVAVKDNLARNRRLR